MKNSYLILMLITALPIAAMAQTSHVVNVTNNKFTPKEITISVGDTVIWTNTEGNHNVNGAQAVYPDNPESFSNEVGMGWTWSFVFTMEGTYDYQCDPHVRSAMFGIVNVEEAIASAVEDHRLVTALEVYPNPASTKTTIRSENELESLSIINLAGQKLYSRQSVGEKEQTLDLEEFPAGIYFIEVKTVDNKYQYGRFIKK